MPNYKIKKSQATLLCMNAKSDFRNVVQVNTSIASFQLYTSLQQNTIVAVLDLDSIRSIHFIIDIVVVAIQ